MKLKSNLVAKMLAILGGVAFSSAALAQNSGGLAPTSGGVSLGQMIQNLTNGLGSVDGLLQAAMYLVGGFFALMFLFKLYKWNKSDGRDATLGGIGICLAIAVLGFTMPMLISGGAQQVYGNGQMRTVAPPPAFR